ncbi:hypothetical protein ATCV1_z699L [Acanthocystis turfacea chlorella virus 1]|uniref:Uncharacterized protein z699L n=1 Tax=Chlorovirus heliozoae TaxID=322019 RepID=A7K9V9_9PHYC|nr:hypothetical protein ATCV1_z699L [Acanthocystis turfacea chlorella virus 1]ABT16833.1 hypothetical protein ATCV1_z699L [Acanthocystis turfacea chlorella virus 1]
MIEASVAITTAGHFRETGILDQYRDEYVALSPRTTAVCPMYVISRDGYATEQNAILTDAGLRWPMSAYIASAPVMARNTLPRSLKVVQIPAYSTT